MSKDPAFLFYDGDAAKDVSHMNRIERGCYFDLIQAQRKFGRLSIDIIKKILGKDFEPCWDSVKICLTYDNDMYFIEWLENSTIKRKEYSENRRKNRLSKNQQDTKNISKTYVEHMENEIENENKNRSSAVNKSEIDSTTNSSGILFFDLDDLQAELLSSHVWIEAVAQNSRITVEQTKVRIVDFIRHLKAGEEVGRSLNAYKSYFRNWLIKRKEEQPKVLGINPFDMIPQ